MARVCQDDRGTDGEVALLQNDGTWFVVLLVTGDLPRISIPKA